MTFRSFHFRPATTSRTQISNKVGRNRLSMAATVPVAMFGIRNTSRPTNHNANSQNSGQPDTGSLPVQFGTAVRRKPASTAEE